MRPLLRESWLDVADAVECLRDDAEKSLEEGTGRDASVVGEIAVALASCCVVETHLSQVAWAVAQIHLVHDVSLQKLVCLVGLSCLEKSQNHVHDFCRSHIVDAPVVGKPIAGADDLQMMVSGGGLPIALVGFGNAEAHVDVRNVAVHVLCGLIHLFGCSYAAIHGNVDGPDGGILMHTLQAHEVLVFSPVLSVFHPQPFVHRLEDGGCFGFVLRSVLAYALGNLGSEEIATIVVCCGVSASTAAIVECIACPNAAIGIVEVVAVGVEVALFPCQMTFQDWPHLLHVLCVGIVLEMPKQLVDVVEVHVVVVHLVVSVGISADISRGVHLRSPFLLCTCHVH